MPSSPVKVVRFTADVVTSDGSDTDVYGDECLPGHGATLVSGWYSPDWSASGVSDERAYAHPYIWSSDDAAPAQWLADLLSRHLNGVEASSSGTFYSQDSVCVDYAEGIDVTVAAHAEGFTNAELTEAIEILSR